MKIYRLSKYKYKNINMVEEEEDDGFDKSRKWLDESNKVFQDSKIRYDSTKEISDIVLNNGVVIGTSATGWNTYGDNCIFSFDIAIQEKYRGRKIGTQLAERAIRKFELERQEYSEVYGKDTIMEIEAVNVDFGEFLIGKYGFTLKQKLPDRVILIRE